MGVTKDKRKEKIKELKTNIKLLEIETLAYRKAFQDFLKTEVPEEEEAKKQEEKAKRIEVLTQKVSILEALVEELKTTRMNKNSSRFFEWNPSPPNRRARRLMARMR